METRDEGRCRTGSEPNNQVAKWYAEAGCQEEERELWGSEDSG